MLLSAAQRRGFSRSAPLLDLWGFSNRLAAREPFTIPWEALTVSTRKKYMSHARNKGRTSLRWYPEASVAVSLGAETDWIPAPTKEVMKSHYPYFYNKRKDEFTVRTDKGTSFDSSTEHVLDTLLHILHSCHKVATRDGSKFVFDRHYLKYGMPLIFRYKEEEWIDHGRTRKSYANNAAFNDVYGKGKGYKLVGGYQPQDHMGNEGYHHAAELSTYDYSPNATYKMDPHFINPALAEKKLGGVSWKA
eukprot:TRINITY_DN18639_c0_g1_i1.p1 TRINITY_DN18639_c0_g1~~TRINITY_DN18639_c0_g1_i1.p1  ORF type:complete len:275 (+),score=107.22 TRINITY_DN18639_c0_g1_i1:86-826(+)